MPISMVVTNKQPEISKDVPRPLLDLFQDYTFGRDGQRHYPFKHQAEAFRLVGLENKEVFLVAGTASGKTLAIAIPLFWKLKQGLIKKVLLMYPTVALLEDQRKVMDTLAEITGLEVGQLQGGMSRTKLIEALNKPVILATPDEVYWFFRKNVKYNSLLIYGLALVDEFVLDEGHLFNGLMLRNLAHLRQRIQFLGEKLGKQSKWHVLTATPTQELQRLMANSIEVFGKSKCNNVLVEIQTVGKFDLAENFAATVNKAIETGYQKILVVCNSARMAHQLFEKYKVKDISTIPLEHRLRFGKVKLGDLTNWLERTDIDRDLIKRLNERLVREENIVLADLPTDILLSIPLSEIVANATEVLEQQSWRIKRVLWEQSKAKGETWESLLNNRPLPCHIIGSIRRKLENTAEVENQQAIVDEWVSDILDNISSIGEDPLQCKTGKFAALINAFVLVGIDKTLASLLAKRLTFKINADPVQLPMRNLSHRPIYLRWLDWAVEKENVDQLREAIRIGLASCQLDVECRHIGIWKGTNVPIIVYSGSMAKRARIGLIDVFSDIEHAVLISTSAVEVGVDFHADVLITEECEGNSFLQRFGRVGRHGSDSKVIAFVSGDVYSALNDLSEIKISREEFSSKIIEIFPGRYYASSSDLLDASHYLVNEQLGRIGEQLNMMTEYANVKHIADQLRTANLQLGFGLRSTMPQITLQDGVTKDPFYLLRYVDDEDLRPSDSPFEVARSKTWFTSLIFQHAKFDVIVDLEETLKASKNVFLWDGVRFHIMSQPGAGLIYLNNMNVYFGEKGGWVKCHPGNFLLLYGDVYLSHIDREIPHPEPVQDNEQNPLFIPNQNYLVLWGWNNFEETHSLLKEAKIVELEELRYDWERLNQDWDSRAMVIMENTTGACFAAYKELVDYVSHQF